MYRMTLLATLAATVLLTGCTTAQSSSGVTTFCDPRPDDPAIRIKVLDSETGKQLDLKTGGYVQEGTYRDDFRLKSYDDPSTNGRFYTLVAATERAGEYDVVVEREGYKTWDAKGINVSTDACGSVNTMTFTVFMEPESKTRQ